MAEIRKISKRDGRIVDFEKARITDAIFKAARAVGGKDRAIAAKLADKVVEKIQKKYADQVPGIEDVQDTVEKVLIEEGYASTAKSYIIYRSQRARTRADKNFGEQVTDMIDDYVGQADWRVKENSNASYSLSGLQAYISGAVVAEYTLKNVYPAEVAKAHREGDLHIHDLSLGTLGGYCAGWSLAKLLEEGFNGVAGRVSAKPAKHLDAALGQMVNYMGTLQNEWAGAQAFSSIDTYLAPLVAKDGLDYKQVKQGIQEFIYSANQTSRWGNQTPFLNITLDWTVPEDMKDKPVIYGGTLLKETYGEFQKEMDMINKAILEVMMEGDADGRIFTFPIPTYNITKDFDWDTENANLLFKMTAKFGIPYFQNFINSDLDPSDVRSMCCRLQLDLRELRNKTGGLFGAGESTGSVGVVTINLPRLGYLARNEDAYFEHLDKLMIMAKTSLEIKRKAVQDNIDRGLLPYTKRYLGTLEHHFSTIGLVGMHESCLNFMGKGIETEEGRAFALKVLDYMRKRISDFQEETGNIYNLEATPAEGTSYRLAKLDKKEFPEIITQGRDAPYYTNSSLLPPDYTEDLYAVLEHQDELQRKYTGGTVLHCFLGERIESVEATKKLVRRVAENYKLPYFSITPTFSICPVHGYIPGEHHNCPYNK